MQILGEDLSFAAGYTLGNTLSPASGIATDGTSGGLFVADTGNNRIKRYTASSGAFQGWFGRTSTVPTGQDDACTSITGGALTPTWCYGGTSQTAATAGTGELQTPRGIVADANYLYIAENQSRLVRISRVTASFAGWLGRTGTSPGTMTGFDSSTTCATNSTTNTFTGAWCAAGNTSASNNGDGSMNVPRAVAVDSVNGYLFVADTSAHRIGMYTTAGAYLGWIGRPSGIPATAGPTTSAANSTCTGLTTSLATTNWCVGGSTQAGNLTGQPFTGFNNPYGVSYANGAIYVADFSNNKIHKFTSLTGAYLGWIGRTATTKPTGSGSGSTIPAAACSTALTLNNQTPGWCVGGGSQASGAGVFDNAFNGPTSLWADPNGNYLYVVDAGNHRITKHDKTSGAFMGWKGVIGVPPTGGDAGCSTAAAGDVTPGWCTGGTSVSSRKLGGFFNPVAVAGDDNFIYVTDSYNNRVVAIPK